MEEFIKTDEEINILRQGGGRLAKTLAVLVEAAQPGISALDLNGLAESLILACGGRPSFKGYRSKEGAVYPYSLCVSVNDEIVHGVPKKEKVLQEGNVVGLDIGMQWPAFAKATAGKPVGLFTDMAVTIGIGKVSKEAERLMQLTKASLFLGIKAIKPGARLGDVGFAIQAYLEKNKLGVIRSLAGHGVGYAVHEEPLVPNFGERGKGLELKKNMVLAIEPMASLGDWKLELAKDGWAFRTKDGSLGAHFEHTVVVREDGAEIITPLEKNI